MGDVLALQRREVLIKPELEYRLVGVYSFGKGIFHHDPGFGADLGHYRFFAVEAGDLVLSNIGAWEGGIALATEADAGMIGNHRLLTYVPIAGRIDTSWARWFFLSEPGMRLIRRAAPGTTMRNRTLAIDRFEGLEIPVPPIEEQRRVARVLDRMASASEQVSVLEARVRVVAEAARTAFTRGSGIASNSLRGDEWRRIVLGETLHLNCHLVEVDLHSTFNMAGVYSFGRGLFERGVLEGSDTRYQVLHELHRGQLVMSRLKAWEGAIALVSPRFEGMFLSPEFPTFDINSELVDPRFLAGLLTSESFWGRLKGASKGIGARKERVSAERLLEQTIEIPPVAKQRVIAGHLEVLGRWERSRVEHSSLVAALVPSLLNHVFAGSRGMATHRSAANAR